MSIPLSLSGKVALISGGSRGIGAATVRMFTAAGAKVVFSFRSARAQAEALATECGIASCHPVLSDLNTPAAARSLVVETVKHFGRLDILVANHGVWPAQDVPIERMSDEQWRSTMSINLDGVFGLVKHSVAQMKMQSSWQRPCRTHRAYQFHQRTAGGSVSLRLLRHQGSSHQHGQKPVNRTRVRRHLRQLCCSGMGRYRHECRCPCRPQKRRGNPEYHPARPRRQGRGNRSARYFSCAPNTPVLLPGKSLT